MQQKIAILAAMLCILAVFSSTASAYLIDKHLVQVTIQEDGTAKVNEKFFLIFRNAVDLVNFRKDAISNGPSLEVWSAFDGNIATHIDSIKGGTGRVIFEEKQEERYVSLEYETRDQVMVKKSGGETSRKILWEINQDVFKDFETSSIYVIPANTSISIILPKNAVLEGDIVPTAVVSGNIISWSGPINVSGKLILEYSTEKQIAPGIGLSKTLQEFSSSGTLPLIIVSLLALMLVIYSQRRKISKKIENYIVDHSQIDYKQGKEEDELD